MTRTKRKADPGLLIRRTDYSLSNRERDIRDHFREFFQREVPAARVRAAGTTGFDRKLWLQLAEVGALSMGLAAKWDGAGSSLVELALVAEEFGRVLAPVPLVESSVALRLLSQCDSTSTRELRAAAAAGHGVVTFALQTLPPGGRQLVAAGAVADAVLGLDGEELVVVTAKRHPRLVPNQASAPLAWWTLSSSGGTRTVLATGRRARDLYSRTRNEWKVLTAAALAGLADAALGAATEYAKERRAFGVPIGTFQAISHALVDSATAVEGGRHLNWKAAWYLDHEPAEQPALPAMSFAHACSAAYKAVTAAIHVHGAAGLLLESELPLYFLRVKTWSLLAGDPQRELDSIAAQLFQSGRRRSVED